MPAFVKLLFVKRMKRIEVIIARLKNSRPGEFLLTRRSHNSKNDWPPRPVLLASQIPAMQNRPANTRLHSLSATRQLVPPVSTVVSACCLHLPY